MTDLHPIHLILGAGDIARINTSEYKIGMGQGGAGLEPYLDFARTSQDEYKQLFILGVLGLQEGFIGDPDGVLIEFNEQLRRLPDGRYFTRLP